MNEIVLVVICLIEAFVIVILFRKYEALYRVIVEAHNPEVILPKETNAMKAKIREDRQTRADNQMAKDFLDLIKIGEANEADIKKFGETIDA